MNRESARQISSPGFLGIQLALAVVVVGLALPAVRDRARERVLPQLRAQPLRLASRNVRPDLVSDAELRAVLDRLPLRQDVARANLAHLDHAFRLWGPRVAVPSRQYFSGAVMQRVLLEHDFWAAVYGRGKPPLLEDDGRAVHFRALEGPSTASHVDHTLATLLEAGMPLDTRIKSPARETSLREVLETSLREFTLYQHEYQWSALAFALAVRSAEGWRTPDNQHVDFDRLSRRLMLARPTEGVDYGQHRLFTLAAFLHVDDQRRAGGEAPMLSPAAREDILEFLRTATDRFVAHQHDDGFWNGRWPWAAPLSSAPAGEIPDTLADRLIVTGHVLEWWAIAPAETLPPDETIERAARWLVDRTGRLSDAEVDENYSFLTHVGSALALWTGTDAAGTATR